MRCTLEKNGEASSLVYYCAVGKKIEKVCLQAKKCRKSVGAYPCILCSCKKNNRMSLVTGKKGEKTIKRDKTFLIPAGSPVCLISYPCSPQLHQPCLPAPVAVATGSP